MTNKIDREVALELTKQNQELRDENLILRRLLWEHHGCPSQCLYGDDGELQCSNPKHSSYAPVMLPLDAIDFRRDSAQLLEWKLGNELCKRIVPRPEK